MLLFILSWAIKWLIFAFWLYLLIKYFWGGEGGGGGGGGGCVCKFWIFTVFTPHIYFIILISIIAGNLVEIKLPKLQSRQCLRKSNLWRYSRKCLRKFNFNEIRSPELSAYHLPQLKEFFPSMMFEIFSSVLAYRIFDLLLVAVFFHYVIYCCQYHEPLR